MWHLFDRMTYDGRAVAGDESALLVPKLKVLRLEINFAPQDEILAEMIQSRWDMSQNQINQDGQRTPSVARLESVRLKFRRRINWMAPFTRMRHWRDQGLDITVSFEGKRWL